MGKKLAIQRTLQMVQELWTKASQGLISLYQEELVLREPIPRWLHLHPLVEKIRRQATRRTLPKQQEPLTQLLWRRRWKHLQNQKTKKQSASMPLKRGVQRLPNDKRQISQRALLLQVLRERKPLEK